MTDTVESTRSVVRGLSGELLSIAVVAVLWLGVATPFAASQEIWTDETTQLSGLTLGPREVVAWLAGERTDRFVVPGDRSPPVSYWLGWGWSRLLGGSEGSLRALGILLVGAASAFVVSASRRAWGPIAGWVSGVAFVLSPNMIVSGVEIRAYPLFVALAAAAFWLLVGFGVDENARNARRWIALTTTCIAASYTHFFGLVLAGAVFLGLLVLPGIRRSALPYWGFAAASVALASVGLIPFVEAAMKISPSGTEPKELVPAVVRLLYRSIGGHPSVTVYWPVLSSFLVGAAILLGAAPLPKPRVRVAHALLVAVGSGLFVVTLVKSATDGFEALSVTYNLWMAPALAIAMGSVAALLGSRLRPMFVGGIALFALGSAGAALVLVLNRTTFAHSAAERVNERVRAAGVSGLTVVHDGRGPWGHAYFPLYYTFGKRLRQYVAEPNPAGGFLYKTIPALQVVPGGVDALGAERILLITVQHQHMTELARFIRTGEFAPLTDGALSTTLRQAGFGLDRSEALNAYISSDLAWMKQKR